MGPGSCCYLALVLALAAASGCGSKGNATSGPGAVDTGGTAIGGTTAVFTGGVADSGSAGAGTMSVLTGGSVSGSGGVAGTSTSSGVNKARPFAPASPFNTRTPDGTKWFDTSVLHTCQGSGCDSDHVRHWWVGTDFGITWSAPSDPTWTFQLPGYTATEWHRTRPATTLRVRAPSTLWPHPDDDRIVLVADPVTGDYVEIWSATVDASSHTVTGEVWATGNMITGPGVGDLKTDLNGGVRASNFSWGAGQITQADLAAKKIDHAIALALPSSMVKGGSAPVGPYLVPATAGNGDWPTGPILMGSKIGIPVGAARPAGLSSLGNMVFDAFQSYGAYVGDVCGAEAPIMPADGPSMGLAPGTGLDSTPFEPLVAFWSHAGSSDMEKIGPLLRVADYQP